MDTLPSIIGALSGLITTLFAGYIAIRQLPQIHRLTNRNFTEQKSKIEELEEQIRLTNIAALSGQAARITDMQERLDRPREDR